MRRALVLLSLITAACGVGPEQDAAWQSQPIAGQTAGAAFYPLEPVLDLRRDSASTTLVAPALSLGDGWSGSEPWGTWAVGPRSTVVASLLAPEARFLLVECRPYRRLPDEPVQAITLQVNDTSCGTFELQERWQQYRLPIPAGVLRAGRNEIVLGHRSAHAPKDHGWGDGTRQLATGFRRLGLVRYNEDQDAPANASPPLSLETDGSLIMTSSGAAVVPLQLPADRHRLALSASLYSPEAGPCHLGLAILTLDGERHELYSGSTPSTPDASASTGEREVLGERSFDLPEIRDTWCFLVIETRLPDQTRLVLREPRLLSIAENLQPPPTPKPPASLPDMVVIILDAARPDHFGCYGYQRPTTPSVDRLASESLVFRRVIAHASYTTCSVPTMVTGLPFTRHGVVSDSYRLGDAATTLAEQLGGVGYESYAISANPHHSAKNGLDQGYDELIETWNHFGSFGRESIDPHVLTRLAVERLQRGLGGKPYLMVLHYIPPHEPYTPPERFDIFKDPGYHGIFDGGWAAQLAYGRGELQADEADRRRLVDLYDGNLRRADDAVGQLLQALQASPRWSETVVLVVADHGEAFWEHGNQGHSKDVYSETLRVPFVLRLPPHLRPTHPVDLDRFASLADIVPTLLGLAGAQPGPELSGSDLLAPVDHRKDPWIISKSGGRRPSYSLSTASWKLVLDRGKSELYHLENDPTEQHDLAAERPLLRTGLTQLLHRALRPSGQATESETTVDANETEALRALGYLE